MLTPEIRATTILLPTAADATLRPGQFIQTNVQGEGDNLHLMLGPNRVPLPRGSGLMNGQWVQVEVTRGDQGLQLRVSPEGRNAAAPPPPASPPAGSAPAAAPASPPATAAPAQNLGALVGQALSQLGALQSGPAVMGLLPPQLPDSAMAMRALLSLFVGRGELNVDLAFINGLLQDAARAGITGTGTATTFAALAGQWATRESRDFRVLLERLGDGRPWEARLAALLEEGRTGITMTDAGRSLRVELGRLAGNAALREFLDENGLLEDFDAAVQRTSERLTGNYLQNLRTHDLPYFFMELPLSPDSGINHAHIHLFNDGQREGRKFDRDNSTLVLDLSLTELGDLWITVRVAQGACQCRIQATNDPALDSLSAAAPDLAAALGAAGFPNAQVAATQWDGNRLREIGALMERFRGLNLQA